MIENHHIALAVVGTITKAATLAREIGQRAMGKEARQIANFIAIEIEALDDPMHGWEEREAQRSLERKQRP